MPQNPFTDIWKFLTGSTSDYLALGAWRYLLVVLFLALIAASIFIALRNWREDPAQRTGTHLGTWFVRGLGAMCAIELVKDVAGGEPSPQLTQALMKVANEKGLILLSCGTYGNVIRFLVPLTASDQIVRDGMDIFEASLTEAVTRVA